MNTINTAVLASAIAATVAFVPHTDAIHFKKYALGTDGQKELKALIDAGKLTDADITVETKGEGDKAVTTWKRKSVSFTVQVPDVTTLVQADVLPTAILSHLQAVIAQRLVDKQKAEVSDLTGKTVSFEDVFSAAYTLRVAVAKVSAEALKAALDYLKAGLEAIGTNPKGLPRIIEMAGKRFSAASAAGLAPDALTAIQTRVVAALPVAAEAAIEAGESDEITAALDMLDKALTKLMTPPEALEADAF